MTLKRLLIRFLLLFTVFTLAACSAAQPTPTAQATPSSARSNSAPNQPRGGNGALPTEEKLAVGILKLEGTAGAVTADQAKLLLPLWQQVQTISADTNTTPDQLQAVYTQIENSLTVDQTKSIDAMNYTMQDLQGLMTDLGIQVTPGAGFNGQGGSTLTADQQATRQAQIETRVAGNPNAAGTPGAQPRFQGTPNPQGTPGAGFGGRGGGFGRGFGSMFVEPVIQLLQQRAGA